MSKDAFYRMVLPAELTSILESTEFVIPTDTDELMKLSLGGETQDSYDVSYEVNGEMLREATVVNCKNGISVNFDDLKMRRRDPNSMVIADDLPTDKTTYMDRFQKPFDDDRKATLDWLGKQKLLVLPFFAGNRDLNIGYPALAVMPINASFFGTGIADLQCFIEKEDVPEDFTPKAIIYIAPPFRHTLYDGKQIVVHNRKPNMHEVFAYNLYPGPSAKKGVYSILLNLGEKEGWNTLHASTVKITTPYELTLTIMHEGASGGGKSEMTEAFHRQEDGKLLLGTNIITGEATLLNMADNCELNPITDDMALAHPSLKSNDHKLVIADAEHGWFLRVDHIKKYGTEPLTERLCFHPHKPLVFFNMDGQPNSTCLIWDHTEDSPGVPCPNPRVIMPRLGRNCILNGAHEIDIRSFGVRTPPCTKEHPSYGIIGMFHVLPPALAWLWRLVAPRGHANPSIVDTAGGQMQSEGVGSYWPFATGRKVDQANLLLEQILNTLNTRYILIPNQYIGAYHTGFGAEWATREYLSRRGGSKFNRDQLDEARCPILGYVPDNIKMDGVPLPKGIFRVNRQLEVGVEAYDVGAKILTDFFKQELKHFDSPDLHPLGKKIIAACMNDAPVETYYNLIPKL
ncbi:MAG: DUF4914 family protein [Bacillota bacterium]